jgi:hypothetical protein
VQKFQKWHFPQKEGGIPFIIGKQWFDSDEHISLSLFLSQSTKWSLPDKNLPAGQLHEGLGHHLRNGSE